jgi:hypothetical protein
MNRTFNAALAILMMFIAGCAAVEQPQGRDSATQAPAVEDCTRWFARLDETVDRAGVRDAAAYRIPGFPYLRADRFSASFRNEAKDDPAAFKAWVDRLRNLDATARAYELRNLPAHLLGSLEVPAKNAATAKTDACAADLGQADLAVTSQREALVARAVVPNDYIEWRRVLGLYPLATLPFSIGVNRWQEETVATFRRAMVGDGGADTVARYEPRENPVGQSRIRAIFARSRPDRLGIPQFSPDDREDLLRSFAPIFEIATSGVYDRFGPLRWGTGPAPEVDVLHPTAYRRLAFTRYRDRVLAQLVYTIWFPERPRGSSLDLLSGRLDGLVFRVTLNPEGQPLVYDTIHPCGCYHMFFPTARVNSRPSPRPGVEWAFVPAILPSVEPLYRIVLGVASRSHYVVNLHYNTGGHGTDYRFVEDDELRALPTIAGTTRSAFGADGIVPGTERGERMLFWPTGVDDTGAMRQWGRHATAFLGRRHFDDPDLIERRFSLAEPLPEPSRVAAGRTRLTGSVRADTERLPGHFK